jgi:Kef-type K+ transport system membrane component KefB
MYRYLRSLGRLFIFVFLFSILFSNSDLIAYSSPDTLENSSGIITQKESHSDEGAGHGDKFANIYLFLFFIIGGAVIGRFVARRLNQPPVLGELVIGVIMGVILYQFNAPVMTLIRHQDDVTKIVHTNLSSNTTWDEAIKNTLPPESLEPGEYGQDLINIMESPSFPEYNLTVQAIFLLSSLGVLLLLFLVGLESDIEEMISLGKASTIVAILGVVLPMSLGYIVTMLLLPDHGTNVYLFVGATLCATSIGITARVFKDMNKLHIPEAKIVLGAAVIDDILGLIVLAVVAGVIASGTLEFSTIGLILLKAALFLGITLFVGMKYLRHQIKFAAIIDNKNLRLLFPFALLVILAWLSDRIGLASIVGAFAAGLIIKEEYFKDVAHDKNSSVKSVMEPIEAIFAPVFFVIMGLQVDLSAFLEINILGIALLLTLVAIVGKLLSGIFIKGMDKKIIGIGMVPRGEVGLIFASIGKSLGVLDSALFSAIIILVILTTFITPPGLKWAFGRYDKR